MLENKKHHELLEPYEQRSAAAVAYLKAVRPSLTVQPGALLDPKVPIHHTPVTRTVQLQCIKKVLITLGRVGQSQKERSGGGAEEHQFQDIAPLPAAAG